MRARPLFILVTAASLSLATLRSGSPLPGASGQEPGAGDPGGTPAAPSPTGIPRHERVKRECGLNSLFLLLRLSGHDVTYDQTRAAVPIGPTGTSLLELEQAASRLGMNTAASRCSMAELRRMPKPLIAYLRHNPRSDERGPGHYVVVLTADETGVEAIDTAFVATYRYPPSMWEAYWTGYILAPAAPQTWTRWLALTGVASLWVGIGLACWRTRVSRRAAASHAPAALAQVEGA